MKTNLLLFFLLLSSISFAQSIVLDPANSSNMMTSTATDKGILIPRMTAAQRSAISSPAIGLMVYQTDAVVGFNTLVKTTTEAAGANCATGGVRLDYGLDANTNNTLDANEIVAALTKYICNGVVGSQGIQGMAGAAGAAGMAGTNGEIVLSGPANPVSRTGIDGDFYINTTTRTLFGPKAGGAWPTGISLVGPTGATEAKGAAITTGLQGIQGATGWSLH